MNQSSSRRTNGQAPRRRTATNTRAQVPYTKNPLFAGQKAVLAQCSIPPPRLQPETGDRAGNAAQSAAWTLMAPTFRKEGRKEDIMLQASEMQQRFTHLQQTISDTSRTCHSDKTIPEDLMNWVDELDRECKSARKVMASHDDDRIRQWVDDLERIGDRAERACIQAGGLDSKIKNAVSSMHSELSDLKRQLH